MWTPETPTNQLPAPAVLEKESSTRRSAASLGRRGVPTVDDSVTRTTIFGKSLLIKGEVSGSEPLQIEGHVEGSIIFSGNHVSIGRDALVAANVIAQEVVIRGTLRGNLNISDSVKIYGGGSVVGDIAARRISIEDGAHCRGSIDMRGPDLKPHLENARSAATSRTDTAQ